MDKLWKIPNVNDEQALDKLSGELNINNDLAALLIQRGVHDFDEARLFFRPSLDHLHDPFLMKDMDKAVNRLSDAVGKQEKILIYGDYDVDGTTSVSLMYLFLSQFTEHIAYYIPDRYTEGYGLSEKGMRWAAEQKFDLVISLDCGIKANKVAALVRDLQMDLIICDHHLPGAQLPDAFAVLDPKRQDCQYPYKELSGCGVGFKLLQGFCLQQSIPFEQLQPLMDLVAVSIASDIVPITGENRVLAYLGLHQLNTKPLLGLKELIEISGRKPPLTISDVVFYIGPRINAAGRLTHASESVRLLVTKKEEELKEFSVNLHERNAERRDFDKSITAAALQMIEDDSDLVNAKSTVLFKADWHKGVIGIVASRCIETYYRPTIILTESGGKATGSARSVEGFDVHEAIAACGDLLEQFGGHMYAAGLTMPIDQVDAFRKKFEQEVSQRLLPDQLIPKLTIDRIIDFDIITPKTYSIIMQMAPFGPQNMQPIFVSEKVTLTDTARILKGQHLKLKVKQPQCSTVLDCIGFGMASFADRLNTAEPFRLAYQIEENEFRGNKSLQLMIKDIQFYD